MVIVKIIVTQHK